MEYVIDIGNIPTSKLCELNEPKILSGQKILEKIEDTENWIHNKSPYIIVMVGLPGRGKSYMANRMCRWLKWKGLNTKLFNIGNYRREMVGNDLPSEWFSPINLENVKKRDEIACKVLDDVLEWVQSPEGLIGMFDATNTTVRRRNLIVKKLESVIPLDRILFVESICDKEDIILHNVHTSKINNADYRGISEEVATKDFMSRIEFYNMEYRELDYKYDNMLKFIKIYNMGERITMNRLEYQLDKKLAYFLMNLHPWNKDIYITRHGESEAQVKNIIGSDPKLTKNGMLYACALKSFIDLQTKDTNKVNILCSTLRRTIQTASLFCDDKKYNVSQWKNLDEIYGGDFEGMTYAYVKETWPRIYDKRQQDKYNSSWPGGETYRQMIIRLESIFLEIENNKHPLVIVAHQAICRGLYAYLMHMLPEDCTKIEIPSHVVFKFTYQGNQPRVEKFNLHLENHEHSTN